MHDLSSLVATLGATGGNLSLLTTLAAGFAAAWVLGLITHRLGLSPIVGYLLAGVAIGPHTPGFIGDPDIAHQLAEVGVILIMFGVGLHFQLGDLLAVRRVAVPGAVGQSAVAMLATIGVFMLMGWTLKSTLVLGMAMAVASTVVLLRVLTDRNMLTSSHGHVAVGWLIVEDIFTVLALVLVPMLAPEAVAAPEAATLGGIGADAGGAGEAAATEGGWSGAAAIGWAVLKLAALVAIVLLAGSRIVPRVLTLVAKLRSSELFTLTVLVLSITIAVGAYVIFGASVALGAFLAGMVVAQSPASHQAAADALPMRDAFGVLFFVAVGMLFDPSFVVEQPLLVLAGLAIVLVFKPLAAVAIVAVLGYPARTALTVALGLAQIGEFSFILAQVASAHGLMPEEGVNLLVATAIISITINPLLFRSLDRIERAARDWPWLWKVLDGRASRRAAELNARGAAALDAGAPADDAGAQPSIQPSLAVIVGYGPVGRLVDAVLRDAGLRTVIIDLNIDTVRQLADMKRPAIYGDGARREVLDQAGVRRASHLVITLPDSPGRGGLVLAARELNPSIHITVRARYLAEREALMQAGANRIVYEEGEVGIALARHVMEERGLKQTQVDRLLPVVRQMWRMAE
jgi:CPA2 family monovalent cation:H+ antiporter-2